MKYLAIFSVLFLIGCAPSPEHQRNVYSSYSAKACFENGGVEYQFHEYTLTGTCVYRK